MYKIINTILSRKDLAFVLGIVYFVIYILIILFIQPKGLYADEYRYYGYGLQLLEGKYALSSDAFLWNGPGNPLIVFIFLKFGSSFLLIRFFNAFLLSASFYLFLTTINTLNPKKYNLILASILVFWPGLIRFSLPIFYTEILCFFLVTLFIFSLNKYLKSKKALWCIIAACSVGFLILTKLSFFYVILICIAALFLLLFYSVKLVSQSIKVLALSLLFVLPYLIYTYKETNKFPYLGNSNGMQLYWMTVEGKHHKGEWHPFPGNWNPFPKGKKHLWNIKSNNVNNWYDEQKSTIETWKTLKPIEANNFLIEKSLENIKKNPAIYFKNIGYNTIRMMFDVPRDGHFKIPFFLLPNIFFIFFIVITFRQLLISLKKYNSFLLIMGLISILYTAETVLLSSYSRFLYVLLPMFFVFTFFELSKYKWYR